MNKKIVLFVLVFLLVGTLDLSGFVSAQSSFSGRSGVANSALRGPRAGFQTYYGGQANEYWPILGDRETCEARQDLLLNVAPAGCEPTVVRSDLLADQNVPVFCQIDAYKINPLIDINQIRNIRFTGDYPAEVVGTGFHPARAALRTNNILLGSPLVNNIGYVVVVLKQEEVEDNLPDFVNISLEADIDYITGNAYGIGRAEFLLDETISDQEWESEKLKQSFWNGRYFVRLEEVNNDYAFVSIYEGDSKVITKRIDRGKTSESSYLPGLYCRAGIQIAFDGYVSADETAKIEVSSGNGYDVFEVTEGSRFMDNRCTVRRIIINGNATDSGKVTGSCGSEEFVLELQQRGSLLFNAFEVDGQVMVPEKKDDGNYEVNMREVKETRRAGRYQLVNGRLVSLEKEKVIVDEFGEVSGFDREEDKTWFVRLWNAMKEYDVKIRENPEYVIGGVGDKKVSQDAKNYFDDAIENYERVVDDYPAESGLIPGDRKYGEDALEEAIRLAKIFGMDSTRARLIEKYFDNYPEGKGFADYADELRNLDSLDYSLSGAVINFDDQIRTLSLTSLNVPTNKPKVKLEIDGRDASVEKGKSKTLFVAEKEVGRIEVEEIDGNSAVIGEICKNKDGNYDGKIRRVLELDGVSKDFCGLSIKLEDVESDEIAKIRLIPQAEGTRTKTNLNVNIGIEKRSIKLNPDKARDKIEDLNETIQKWEKISEEMGNVVSGLKGACFATSAVLTFKNFLTGLNGESLARQQVMGGDKGWRQYCKEHVSEYEGSIDKCYLDNANDIDRDVSKMASAYNDFNDKVQEIQSNPDFITSSSALGKSVNAVEVRKALADEARREYGSELVKVGDENVEFRTLLTPENVKSGAFSTDEIKDMMINFELRKRGGLTTVGDDNVNDRIDDGLKRMQRGIDIQEQISRDNERENNGLASHFLSVSQSKKRHVPIVRAGPQVKDKYKFGEESSHTATYIGDDGKTYILELKEEKASDKLYSTQGVTLLDGTPYSGDVGKFIEDNNLGSLRSEDKLDYTNRITDSDRVVKFYENEPYKGMPAVVPFDSQEGWYAATRQTLPVLGGIGAFDASGRVTSFWLCNVGENHQVEFESGLGDDLCQQINLQTGQPLGYFPGLSESKSRSLVDNGVRAIQEASRQYGQTRVSILGENFAAKGTAAVQGTQCQDFMSPTDCHLMFNVCDPVICPNSRCDLGGKFRVANVQQTGIVGGALLCLPNVKEGIVMPVCLSGIQAGVDGLLSIMTNYRDCLSENVETGKHVGICDQIYSIYLCDFFWGQVAPFVNVLIPKLVEIAYGQGTRGGAEYLTVMSAWNNVESSINYFTNTYAVNSLKAFQARTDGVYGKATLSNAAISEIGGEVCKSWISAKAPNAFKSLVEPDSPPQFHAWFDSKTFTSATVPATSQYKVFYHIFAGKDAGVHYNVYLKNPPEGAYYVTAPTLPVATDYIPSGEYASETIDFTAPEGYKELCVRINEEEECGFAQVSTSFAVNYLRDEFIQEELNNENIQTEEACISGSPSFGSLLTPNIQGGVEEIISPSVYNRGVVRICSTQNPGTSTDPGRFTRVGTCGDPKIGCWIDQRSVSNALSEGNIGAINETLENLRVRSIELLQNQDELYDESSAIVELRSLEEAWQRMKSSRDGSDEKRKKAETILERADVVFDKLVINGHKAQLLLTKARVNGAVAESLWTKENTVSKDDKGNCLEGYHEVDDACVPDEVVDEGNGGDSGSSGGEISDGGSGAVGKLYNRLEVNSNKRIEGRAGGIEFIKDSDGILSGVFFMTRGDEKKIGVLWKEKRLPNSEIANFEDGAYDMGIYDMDELIVHELGDADKVKLEDVDVEILDELRDGDYTYERLGGFFVEDEESEISKISCKFTSAAWEGENEGDALTTIYKGGDVWLTVRGNKECNGEEVNFEVKEWDRLRNDPVSSNIDSGTMRLKESGDTSITRVKWNIPININAKDAWSYPEIYFTTIASNVKSVSSKNMELTEPVLNDPNDSSDDDSDDSIDNPTPEPDPEPIVYGLDSDRNVLLGGSEAGIRMKDDNILLVGADIECGKIENGIMIIKPSCYGSGVGVDFYNLAGRELSDLSDGNIEEREVNDFQTIDDDGLYFSGEDLSSGEIRLIDDLIIRLNEKLFLNYDHKCDKVDLEYTTGYSDGGGELKESKEDFESFGEIEIGQVIGQSGDLYTASIICYEGLDGKYYQKDKVEIKAKLAIS